MMIFKDIKRMKKMILLMTSIAMSIVILSEIVYGQNQQLEQIKPAHVDSLLNWYDVCELGILGQGWYEAGREFVRLPAKAETMVTKQVWGLSHHSAGLNVRFVTNATKIQARWTLTGKTLALPHMAATGVSGLDLYVKTEKYGWRFVGTGKPK